MGKTVLFAGVFLLMVAGCGDPRPSDGCSRCGPGTVCEDGRCVADNGGGGNGDGGGEYQDPCTYVVCQDWETCNYGYCNFRTTSQWDVVAARGVVADQDSNGDAWDALGGAPDPYVCMTVNGDQECTFAAQDTFHPVWNTELFSRAGAGSLMGGIDIDYYDDDLSDPDPICGGTITVTKQDFEDGSITVQCNDAYGNPTGSQITFTLDFVQ